MTQLEAVGYNPTISLDCCVLQEVFPTRPTADTLYFVGTFLSDGLDCSGAFSGYYICSNYEQNIVHVMWYIVP